MKVSSRCFSRTGCPNSRLAGVCVGSRLPRLAVDQAPGLEVEPGLPSALAPEPHGAPGFVPDLPRPPRECPRPLRRPSLRRREHPRLPAGMPGEGEPVLVVLPLEPPARHRRALPLLYQGQLHELLSVAADEVLLQQIVRRLEVPPVLEAGVRSAGGVPHL